MCVYVFIKILSFGNAANTGDFVRAVLILIPHHGPNALNLLPPLWWGMAEAPGGFASPLRGRKPSEKEREQEISPTKTLESLKWLKSDLHEILRGCY